MKNLDRKQFTIICSSFLLLKSNETHRLNIETGNQCAIALENTLLSVRGRVLTKFVETPNFVIILFSMAYKI